MIDDENIESKTLQRARFIAAAIYFLLLLAYFITIVVFIVRYPRCAPVGETHWWENAVFLRFSSRTTQLNEISQRLDEFQQKISAQAVWIPTVFRLSDRGNPLDWRTSSDANLTNFIEKLHQNDLRVLVDFPVNQLSIQSAKFVENDRSFFVWNEGGNESNWNSSWIFDARTNSFYLRQLDDPDAIDVNFRNNRVLDEFLAALADWHRKFAFDGWNLQGISYAYEDFDFRNNSAGQFDRTRHLEEDYFLLHRIRQEIAPEKILLLDRLDSLATTNESQLSRYFDDTAKFSPGVQLATIEDFVVSSRTNVAELFDRYGKSTFYSNVQPFVWTSNSNDSTLNEAFFAASLFHLGSISIDVEFVPSDRLGTLIKSLRKLDVFREGKIEQKVYAEKNWLTIERWRRGSRHYMIVVNFSEQDGEQQIELTRGLTSAVEAFSSNIANPSSRYETNSLIDMGKPIELKSYEYLIVRWSPTIDGLAILF